MFCGAPKGDLAGEALGRGQLLSGKTRTGSLASAGCERCSSTWWFAGPSKRSLSLLSDIDGRRFLQLVSNLDKDTAPCYPGFPYLRFGPRGLVGTRKLHAMPSLQQSRHCV